MAALAACDGGDGSGEGGFGGFGTGGNGNGGSATTSMTTANGGAGGAGGAGVGGNGGSGAGTTTMCDGKAICIDQDMATDDCATCSIQPGGACRTLALACNNEAACAMLDACVGACAPGAGYDQCRADCITMYQSGEDTWNTLYECIFCTACPMTCMEPSCMQ